MQKYEFLNQLENIIEGRKQAEPDSSYTAKLFHGGIDRILKKIGEEAGEVIIAAKNNDQEELAYEAADLIYHLLVLLHHQNMDLQTIVATLEKRHKPDQ